MNAVFGLAGDRGANAAEKTGVFGRWVLLTGLDSATLVGLDGAARGVGTKEAAFARKMEGPVEAGTGRELGLAAGAGGAVDSSGEIDDSSVLGADGPKDALGRDVVISLREPLGNDAVASRMDARRKPPVREVRSMVLPSPLPDDSPPSELMVVSPSS